MKTPRPVVTILCTLFAATGLGLVAGCNTGSEEVPLAKVPPPPEGFGQVKKGSNVPSSASPEDANARRR